MCLPRRRRLFGETARAFSAYADVLEKNPSSTTTTTPSGIGTTAAAREEEEEESSDVSTKHSFRSVRAGTKELQFITEIGGRTDGFTGVGKRRVFLQVRRGREANATDGIVDGERVGSGIFGRVASGNVGRRMSSAFRRRVTVRTKAKKARFMLGEGAER